MLDINNFDTLKIGLASPEEIRVWSRGEVKKPETINYRTLKPEREGLFCEKIFGPVKDWECHCGKYKRVRYRGIVCDRCGVEVTRAKVRRERMGHIELAAPVSHIWYFKGIPSRLGLLLDISPRALEKVLYFASYIVIDAGETYLSKGDVINESEYREYRERYEALFKAGKGFVAEMGAEAVKKLLEKVDLESLAEELREDLKTASGQKKIRTVRRLEVVEAFRSSGNIPDWMVLDVIPVISPDLRPMVQLDGGRFATSDLNDLYRRVINRNNRLKRLLDLGAPDIIVRNEKRMLQEAVDALIDNGRRGRPVTGPGNRPLKSLSDMLKGKQGRFRQNLLGKRVDYSGRSVIVVGPELKIYQCGLPKEMALELFKPFVMKKLVKDGLAQNIKSAKKSVEKIRPEVWDVLEDVIKEHPVLLNRAPTLHRLGIQAFEPVLVEGKAIQIHPLVCVAYNADFDGDQMAVHVPLSAEAQSEARLLMLSAQNILNPKDGLPVTAPTQDIVLGCYYLTLEKEGALGEGTIFSGTEEAVMAYDQKFLDLQARIFVNLAGINKDQFRDKKGVLLTTVGKLIFNDIFPADFSFINNSDSNKFFSKENVIEYKDIDIEKNLKEIPLDDPVKKAFISKIISWCYRKYGNTKTAEILDEVKTLGFHFATKAGITVAIEDIIVPKEKVKILKDAEALVDDIDKKYNRGLITEKERYNRVIEIWSSAKSDLTKTLMNNMDKLNPIYMMANSGARGNESQITQLAGMRGLMADPTGKIIDLPIKANFREGLTVLEYFISTHGARKGLADTALKTADSGYLTRRLVDVSQDVIVRELDCGTTHGVDLAEYMEAGGDPAETMERVVGRYLLEPVYHPVTAEQIADAGDLLDEDIAEKLIANNYAKDDILHPETGEVLVKAGTYATENEIEAVKDAKIQPEEVLTSLASQLITEIRIRSVLTCKSKHGVCVKCYGRNLATGKIVDVGEAVGIIAAQSIGEPGTQLTMRTFHTGGVAGADITQGLPRVEELFEARKPKGQSLISEIAGMVEIFETRNKEIRVISEHGDDDRNYQIPYGARVKVSEGQKVNAGDEITEGSINPHELLNVKGVRGVQLYMLQEVQNVYHMQGVDINDKHIEVIVRQMLKKVKVEESGDTEMLPNDVVDNFTFEEINEKVIADGGEPAAARPLLLGITKASLATDSFLSAASFQETTRVLTEAAIRGRSDPLLGLKENVIIGKLIPAGTGMTRYRNINVHTTEDLEENILPANEETEEEPANVETDVVSGQ